MAATTLIGWTDRTMNPWWGCSRVSPACRFCYADRDSKRYNPGNEWWRKNGPRRMMSEQYWREPLKWNRQAEAAGLSLRVFAASMADVFEDHPDVIEARQRLFDLIAATPWLTWQLLTKRPANIAAMVPAEWLVQWPANVWIGTSVETQRYVAERVPYLLALPAAVRFLSCEPLLGRLDLAHVLGPDRINWVISGGESGAKTARLWHPDWARSLRDQSAAADVPFFWKQNGEWTPDGSGQHRVTARRYRYDVRYIGPNGEPYTATNPPDMTPEWAAMYRKGRKAPDQHTLDGVEHFAYPPLRTA